MDPWTEFRSEMPVAEKWAYFDHAAVGPIPRRSAMAIEKFSREASMDGDFHWPSWSASAASLRSSAAQLIGAHTDEIALMANTTLGIQAVALSFPWRTGDSIVLPSNEFPSNQLPWLSLRRRGIQVRRVAPALDGSIDLAKLAQAIDSTTRLVSLSWVGYATGHRVNLHDACHIAHRQGAEIFVDAIQGLGVFPLDVSQVPIDYAAADGHKWMLGPEGAGMLYIRRERLEKLQDALSGWNSLQASHEFVCDGKSLKSTAARFEGGSANHVGQIGFGASLEMLLRYGCNIRESGFAIRVLELTQIAREKLLGLGADLQWQSAREPRSIDDHGSGIISFSIPGHDPQEVRRHLIKSGCVLSVRHGMLRIAIHAYNHHEDIDRLACSIKELI